MMGKRHPSATLTRPRVQRTGDTGLSDQQVTAMLQPSGSEIRKPLAVRDGQGAPVTCAACGCRLAQTGEAWFHFNPLGGRDARGCRIACVDAAHDSSGRAVALAV